MGNILNVSNTSPGPHLCYTNNPFYKWCDYPIYNISTINNAIQAMKHDSQFYILKRESSANNTLWTAPDTLIPSLFVQIDIPYSIIEFSIYGGLIICVTTTNQLIYSERTIGSPWSIISTPEPVLSASIYKNSISIVTTSNKLYIKDTSISPWNVISNGIKKAQQWDKMLITLDINNSLQYTIYNNCAGGYIWRAFQTSSISPVYTTAIEFSLFANNIAILTPTNQVILGWIDPSSLVITWYPVTTISSPINKISLYNGLLTIVDTNGSVGIMNYMSTKLNPLNIDTYAYSDSSCLGVSNKLSITPSILGKTSWDLVVDGKLVLNTEGRYTIIPNDDMKITFKIWGAGSMSGRTDSIGGAGGFTTATVLLKKNVSYLIVIGSPGRRNINTTAFGGGGGGYMMSSSMIESAQSQGGGYSGLFINTETQTNALLIAGGGGGVMNNMPGSRGGAGGGLISQVAFAPTGYPCSQANQQAGQTIAPPYAGPLLGAGGKISPFPSTSLITSNYTIGGSGGGYFGGGLSTKKSNCSFGAGGSGFVSTSTEVQNGSTVTGNYEVPPNTSDPDYISGSSVGTKSPNTQGGNGLVVLSLVM